MHARASDPTWRRIGTRRYWWGPGLMTLMFLVVAALAAPAGASAAPGAASGDGVVPVEEPDNPTCGAGLIELKTTDENPDDQVLTDGTLSVTLDFRSTGPGTALGEVVDWSSNIGVDQVIVKGGPNGNSYVYTPEDLADTQLHAPINPNNDKYYGISHVSFCYDIELKVEKTAETSFTRDYDWKISKSNDAPDPVELSPGQTFEANYKVIAEVEKYADSGYAVNGQITITNPAAITANGVQVTDVIQKEGEADISATSSIDCNGEAAGSGLPASIAAGASLVCTYSAALPDGTDRNNKAAATSTTAGIGEGSHTVPVAFGAPTSEVDECIDVSDTVEGPLGEVCVADSPKTFEYSETFGPFENVCETYEFPNTASFVTNDIEETGEASSTVKIEVQCTEEGGCTLTQGYWKTHSEHGPAPYDETWALLANGADTPFFTSGMTWYQAFWTPPKGGNAYLILAHQYEAAHLNMLNEANVPEAVAKAMTAAEAFLGNYAKYNGAKGKARSEMLELAAILGAYNEGATGPGHCSEDGTSSSSE